MEGISPSEIGVSDFEMQPKIYSCQGRRNDENKIQLELFIPKNVLPGLLYLAPKAKQSDVCKNSFRIAIGGK